VSLNHTEEVAVDREERGRVEEEEEEEEEGEKQIQTDGLLSVLGVFVPMKLGAQTDLGKVNRNESKRRLI
jgi:hypothetical protein